MLRVSKYTLKRPLLGKQVVVSFDCPQCGSSLKCEPSDVGHTDECAFCNVQFTLDKQPLEKFLANEKQKAQQRALEKRDKEIEKDKRKAKRVLQEEDKLEELKRAAYRQRQIDEAQRKQVRQSPNSLSKRADKVASKCEMVSKFLYLFGALTLMFAGLSLFVLLANKHELFFVFTVVGPLTSGAMGLLIAGLLFEALAVFLLNVESENLARVDE